MNLGNGRSGDNKDGLGSGTGVSPVCWLHDSHGRDARAWSLDISEPQRGSVPKPNVVPRLRDYVGLACKHDGNPNGVAATFAFVSIIIGHLVSR